MKGGGWGFTGASSIPGVPGTVSNPQVFTGIGDCRATEPGYWIPQSSYGQYQKGLPGMSGGKRRKRRSMKQKGGSMVTTGQRGGRYTFDLSQGSVNGVAPNAAAWWAGTYPPVQRIACEGSTPNPLNPGPHTPSTQPTPVASANLHLNPQSGGAGANPGTVGVGDVDSMYYYAPTAGYDNKPSTWVDSVGAPVQLQIPFAARELNPSCLTTGHPPPLTGALQKGGSKLTTGQGGGSLWNSLKNSVKKVTNTVGLTRKNNGLAANVGAVYNNVGNVRNNVNALAANNSQLNANMGRVYNNLNVMGPPAITVRNTQNLPPLPASPMSPIPNYPPNTMGGKRRKGSKKSRKARKGRKH